MNKIELISYLDELLDIDKFSADSSKNWLQVDNSRHEIKKIWYAVDANSYIFDKAIEAWIDLLLVHHGMYWGAESVMTWLHYERVKKLIDSDMWLYAAHLPLDANVEFGNNAWLMKAFINIFALSDDDYEIEEFGEYHGYNIWFWLRFKRKIHVSNIVTPYAEQLWLIKKLYNFGDKEYISSVCFVSGGWGDALFEAKEKDFDVFITWEMVHFQIVQAKELWQTILVWWHYETEKFWPKLLAHHLHQKHGIEVVFLDEKY